MTRKKNELSIISEQAPAWFELIQRFPYHREGSRDKLVTTLSILFDALKDSSVPLESPVDFVEIASRNHFLWSILLDNPRIKKTKLSSTYNRVVRFLRWCWVISGRDLASFPLLRKAGRRNTTNPDAKLKSHSRKVAISEEWEPIIARWIAAERISKSRHNIYGNVKYFIRNFDNGAINGSDIKLVFSGRYSPDDFVRFFREGKRQFCGWISVHDTIHRFLAFTLKDLQSRSKDGELGNLTIPCRYFRDSGTVVRRLYRKDLAGHSEDLRHEVISMPASYVEWVRLANDWVGKNQGSQGDRYFAVNNFFIFILLRQDCFAEVSCFPSEYSNSRINLWHRLFEDGEMVKWRIVIYDLICDFVQWVYCDASGNSIEVKRIMEKHFERIAQRSRLDQGYKDYLSASKLDNFGDMHKKNDSMRDWYGYAIQWQSKNKTEQVIKRYDIWLFLTQYIVPNSVLHNPIQLFRAKSLPALLPILAAAEKRKHYKLFRAKANIENFLNFVGKELEPALGENLVSPIRATEKDDVIRVTLKKGFQARIPRPDRNFEYVTALDSRYEIWQQLAKKWVKQSRSNSAARKTKSLARFFASLHVYGLLPNDPKEFFLRSSGVKDLASFLHTGTGSLSEYVKDVNDTLYDFLRWVYVAEIEANPDANKALYEFGIHRFRQSSIGGKRNPLEALCDIDPRFVCWKDLAEEWIRLEKRGRESKHRSLSKFIAGYLPKFENGHNVSDFLKNQNETPFLVSEYGVPNKSSTEESSNKHTRYHRDQQCVVHNFLTWVILERLCSGDHHQTSVYRFRIPDIDGHSPERFESVRSPLAYRYIRELRQMIEQGESFSDWKRAQNLLASGRKGGDWYPVSEKIIDKNDPDCVWILRKTTKWERTYFGCKDQAVFMWSPVRSMILFLKLHLPLRTFQIRMLDSGEADTFIFDGKKWQVNESKHAKGSKAKPHQQGVLRRKGENILPILHINTNKTADLSQLGGELGYDLEWRNEKVVYWLTKLRNWQVKYNPVSQPTKWTDLTTYHLGFSPPSAELFESRGASFFLFRNASALDAKQRSFPIPSCTEAAWYRILLELEQRVNSRRRLESSEGLVEFVKSGDKQGTLYPLHSLRVSLLTAFAIDGKVPLHILSKFVAGHSSILMTIYYVKPSADTISSVLSKAEDLLEQKSESIDVAAPDGVFSCFSQSKVEDLFGSPHGLAAYRSQQSTSSQVFNDIGFCPVSAMKCDIGFDTGRTKGGDIVFGPVPGYPTQKLCTHCRFFVTGPAFLPGLVALANSKSFEINRLRSSYIKAQQGVQALENERYQCELAGEVFLKENEFSKKNSTFEALAESLDGLLREYISIIGHVSRCIEIANSSPSNKARLLSISGFDSISARFSESEDDLCLVDQICRDSQQFKSIDASRAILRRSQLFDAFLAGSNKKPLFFSLSEEEQLVVGNEFSKLLRSAMGANLLTTDLVGKFISLPNLIEDLSGAFSKFGLEVFGDGI